MNLKEEGNLIYVLGTSFNEMGGSHYSMIKNVKSTFLVKVFI